MSLRTQVIMVVALLLAIAVIFSMVRKRQLELKYVLAWIFCALALIVITLFPGLLGEMTRFLGINSPMNMVFFLGFVFSLIIIFSLTVALSRVTERVRKLAQELALHEEGAKRTGHSE